MILRTADSSTNLQASGTALKLGSLASVDIAGTASSVSSNNTAAADVDVVARDTRIGKFAKIDLHGSHGEPCTYWGMTTPAE